MGSSAEGCASYLDFRWNVIILTTSLHEDVPAILQA